MMLGKATMLSRYDEEKKDKEGKKAKKHKATDPSDTLTSPLQLLQVTFLFCLIGYIESECFSIDLTLLYSSSADLGIFQNGIFIAKRRLYRCIVGSRFPAI